MSGRRNHKLSTRHSHIWNMKKEKKWYNNPDTRSSYAQENMVTCSRIGSLSGVEEPMRSGAPCMFVSNCFMSSISSLGRIIMLSRLICPATLGLKSTRYPCICYSLTPTISCLYLRAPVNLGG